MTTPEFEDEILMAFADGQLDAETARRVAATIAVDASVSARVEMFRATRNALREAEARRPLEPVSDALMQHVQTSLAPHRVDVDGTNVVSFGPRGGRPAFRRPMAIAASVALVVGVVGGFIASGMIGLDCGDRLGIAALDNPQIAAALATVRSGERQQISGGEIAVITSFRNGVGEFCREFEIDSSGGNTLLSVACHIGRSWDVRLAVVDAGSDDTGYAPASSLETLDAYLTATEAGAPMPPDIEAESLAVLPK
jgi:hypothetical protein